MKTALGTLALFWSLVLSAYSQVTVPKEVEPFQPIIAECSVAVDPQTDTQIRWAVSSDKVQFEKVRDSLLHIWAPPGEHWVEATVAQQKYQKMLVLVPDPQNPTDLTKAKPQEIKIALSFSVNTYKATFKVKGSMPTPGPLPTPVNTPDAALQATVGSLKALMGRSDPAKTVVWAGAWGDFLLVLREGTTPKSVGEFKAAIGSFTNAAAAKAQLTGAFPGWSVEFEKAFVAHFGSEDGALDSSKAQRFIEAVVWACMPPPKAASVSFTPNHSAARLVPFQTVVPFSPIIPGSL